MMAETADLDRLAKPPTFQSISGVRKFKNGMATALVWLAFGVAIIPLVWVLYTVIQRGFPIVLNADWWQKSLSGLLSRQQGGGVYHAIYGTLVQGLICALISVPIGMFVGVYLVEYGGRSKLAKATTFMVDILTGVPSIVAALFVYSLWITTFGFGRSAFAVSLALVLLMVPVIVRTTEEMLKIVPDELREASYALGIPKWKTIVKIVLPTALSGILTGIMLALARVMGETAPVLVLAAYAPFINYNLFDGPMASLPLLMTTERNNPTDAGFDRLWGAAITLVLIITLFNLLATAASRWLAPKTK
ncbi:phosphate ABC transporter permease PstA [Actinosynnema pretiosum subsp. pretiosum]|uniref:Phosphate transport system permease protein PstA n=2 Tax=Actinosynnema TaxID=40566 RepID=C6WPR4_ACTMD|nr:phosphate ABC transporter permease PstA [Actinosynnema mirum]ACU40615.1 phosphate ABC transporter, inner membrane subunit PstA [Actinosynnema mirum DSM 43827]AXX34129.1 Phosphate transport system permease protein PstA [Actinosynnema pretiosum subsp. pretiosum]QUF02145.1 phosphate ABC transporter permease PstA [Actinosynnema pretiosum subsp. pretiosum]